MENFSFYVFTHLAAKRSSVVFERQADKSSGGWGGQGVLVATLLRPSLCLLYQPMLTDYSEELVEF